MGLQPGDTLMMHSSLFSLGLLKGYKPAEQANRYLHILLEVIGENGTLITPAFNFGFCKGEPFHRQKTPSDGMGVLSETIRTHKNSIRSKHPMQSVSVIGRHSEWITEPDTISSFSENGPFHRFIDLNGKLLLLGSSLQAAALVHWVEQRQKVPYRKWTSFNGEYIDDSEKIHEVRTYEMYARDLKLNPLLILQPIEDRLKETGRYKLVKLGMGSIKLTTANDFIRATQELLEKDPLSLLSNANEIMEQL